MSSPRERLRALWHFLRTPFTATIDPRTGDALTGGEHASWIVQRVMRRWAFLGVITLVTILCWATNDAVRNWWNYGASYAALVIEGVTAMALINQTVRDAIVSRATRRMEEQNVRMEQAHGAQLSAIQQAQARIVATQEAQARQIAAVFELLNADFATRLKTSAAKTSSGTRGSEAKAP